MNILLSHMHKLSDTELRVIIVILGTQTMLSVADIQQQTGRGRQVYQAIKSLQQRHIIEQNNAMLDGSVKKWSWRCTLATAPVSVQVTTETKPTKKPSAVTKQKTTNPNQHHVGVVAYMEITNRRPKQLIADEIAQTVSTDETEIERWKSVVKQWVLNGWNPNNIDGMLNAYKTNTHPTTQRRKIVVGTHVMTTQSVDEQERKMREYLRENGVTDETN